MRIGWVAVVMLVACSSKADAPEPAATEPAKVVSPRTGTVKEPCMPGDKTCVTPIPEGLKHPMGTRDCKAECEDARAMSSAHQRINGYSAPPGKDEAANERCLAECARIRDQCAAVLASGDDSLRACIMSLAVKDKYPALCFALRDDALQEPCRTNAR